MKTTKRILISLLISGILLVLFSLMKGKFELNLLPFAVAFIAFLILSYKNNLKEGIRSKFNTHTIGGILLGIFFISFVSLDPSIKMLLLAIGIFVGSLSFLHSIIFIPVLENAKSAKAALIGFESGALFVITSLVSYTFDLSWMWCIGLAFYYFIVSRILAMVVGLILHDDLNKEEAKELSKNLEKLVKNINE